MDRRTFLGITAGAVASTQMAGFPRPPAQVPDMPLYLPMNKGGALGQTFADAHIWVRDEPGIFLPLETSDAGAGLLWFADANPPTVTDFAGQLGLFDQARSVGLNILDVTLWQTGHAGDYFPAKPHLKEFIAAVHKRRGYVILKVNGVFAAHGSAFGGGQNDPASRGRRNAVLVPEKGSSTLTPYVIYGDKFTMCPATKAWSDRLAWIAQKIVDLDADGIYFDSWGGVGPITCYATDHNHTPGDANAFNVGEIANARRIREIFTKAGKAPLIFTEADASMRHGLVQYTDGSLMYGIYHFVGEWVWDAQGKTDSFVPGYSVDHWNQIVAIGAKLACPWQLLQPPPGGSAYGFLSGKLNFTGNKKFPQNYRDLNMTVMLGLHQWRNAGLILGIPMPSFGDLEPTKSNNVPPIPMRSTASQQQAMLTSLLPRAREIDTSLGSKTPPPTAPYLKRLMDARRQLASVIDYGGTISRVGGPSPTVTGWRFFSNKGIAFTAVNVGEKTQEIRFIDVPAGVWKDFISGETFLQTGSALNISLPPHRARLLLLTGAIPLRPPPQPPKPPLPKTKH
jgi:hypothetical protein